MNIGIDLDEVMSETMITFCKWYNKENNTSIYFRDYTDYKRHLPNIQHINDSFKLWWKFYKTKDHENMDPIKDAVIILKRLAKKNDLYIITSRHEITKESTSKWIDLHFGDIFKDIIYLEYLIENKNQLLKHESELILENKIKIVKTKAQIVKELNIKIIIDDSINNLNQCAEEGVTCILFQPEYRYTPEQLTNLNQNIKIINSWTDIEKEIEKQNSK